MGALSFCVQVTGLMPTRGRRVFAAQALQSFLSQDYPDKRLLILDDSDDPSFPDSVSHELVDYHRLKETLNIPQKRNRLCQMAKGEVLMHFDSDDWSAPQRMSSQVQFLKDSGKAMVGYQSLLFYEENTGIMRQWNATRWYYAAGTSLCFLKAHCDWIKFNESKWIASDNGFIADFHRIDQLATTAGGVNIVARLHAGNTGAHSSQRWKVFDGAIPEGFPCSLPVV